MAPMSDHACAEVLKRIRATYESADGWHLELDGVELERIAQSSRYIHRLPDKPYVVKVDHGHAPAQGVHEWYFYTNHVKGHVLEPLFAPTRAMRVHGYDHAYPMYSEPGKAQTQRWICVMTMQDHVNDGAPHVPKPTHNVRDECTKPILEAFKLGDVDGRQCVYDAGRGHYMLVDYGISWAYDDEMRAMREAMFEEVRTSEKVLVKPTLTDSA